VRSVAILSASVIAILCASPAFADNSFFVELGADMPAADAQAQWQSLSGKYKNLLGNLHYYPKKVLQGGSSVATRMQAGPLTDRAAADKLCSRLFHYNVSCFVIEGVNDAPPSTVISLSEHAEGDTMQVPAAPQIAAAPVTLPWLAKASPVENKPEAAPEPQVAARPVVLPWLRESATANPDAQEHVEVAEAVRVPLTESVIHNTPVDVRSLPQLDVPSGAAMSSDSVENGIGWLHVSAFPDEDMALAFWEGVRQTVPNKIAGLRVRIVRPLLARNDAQTSVNIGPFSSRGAADNFCSDGVRAVNPRLNCRFGGGEPEQPSVAAIAESDTRYARGDAYSARRTAMAHRRMPADASPASSIAHKSYWVQVLSAPTQIEALHQWEQMRAGNAGLLKGKRSSISSSRTGSGGYAVRVGPMDNDGDALNLCGALKNRGVECRVLLYSSR
jgi:hypothetical protein